MFAFELPYGSNGASGRPPALDPPAPGTPGSPVSSDLLAPIESAAQHGPERRRRQDIVVDGEQLALLLATALRGMDCGVVVCNATEKVPALLVLGRRRAVGDAGASPGIAFGSSVAAPPGDDADDADRSLLTLLFIDIVASTETAERLGDQAWRHLLDRYREVVRERLAAYRGVEIDNAGDGFFATFDSPARAVRCAAAIDSALSAIGVSIRAGIHAGECAAAAGRVSGVAVHVAARIVEAAHPGEVLVSGTVRDLVAGSGLEFCDRDWHALKGLSGSRQLFALQQRVEP